MMSFIGSYFTSVCSSTWMRSLSISEHIFTEKRQFRPRHIMILNTLTAFCRKDLNSGIRFTAKERNFFEFILLAVHFDEVGEPDGTGKSKCTELEKLQLNFSLLPANKSFHLKYSQSHHAATSTLFRGGPYRRKSNFYPLMNFI